MVGRTEESKSLLAAKNSVLASVERRPSEAERLIEKARENMTEGLRALITDARAGNPASVKKLRIFGSVRDPAIATKLALMNHDDRRRYMAQLRKAKGKARARKAAKG